MGALPDLVLRPGHHLVLVSASLVLSFMATVVFVRMAPRAAQATTRRSRRRYGHASVVALVAALGLATPFAVLLTPPLPPPLVLPSHLQITTSTEGINS